MTATKLRLILAAVLAVLIIGFGTGAWFAQQLLTEKVHETNRTRIEAEVGQLEVQKLQRLKDVLGEQKDIVERAKQIAASPSQYRYQDQIVSDVSAYANRRGIQISNFDFNAPAQKKDAATIPGAEKVAFALTLKGPLAYETFLQFLRDLESNLTKIQVTSLTLTPDSKDPRMVTNPSLSLEVYIKK